jgi:hypothetical protein
MLASNKRYQENKQPKTMNDDEKIFKKAFKFVSESCTEDSEDSSRIPEEFSMLSALTVNTCDL